MNKFGGLTWAKEEEREMLLRHLTAILDIDTAQESKIGGEQIAKRVQIVQLIIILELHKTEVTSLWPTTDQLYLIASKKTEILQALSMAYEQTNIERNSTSDGI